jgi:hypothetical protein
VARRGDLEGAGARDLSLRGAILALALGLAAGCATARTDVFEPLREPVRRVSLTFDPVEGATQAELDELALAIARPLIVAGIDVVPHGRDGAPELIGHVGDYRPGVHLRAGWLLLAPNGDTLGQCRTDFGISASSDWGDVVQGTGQALAAFLAGP